MSAARYHADELDVDAARVQRLLSAQFPEWAHLPLEPFASAGTENAIYRLGKTMAVRLPRRAEGSDIQVEKEQHWLPILAPQLPLAIPEPLERGLPGEGYPCRWSVFRWLEGEVATRERIADLSEAAQTLAEFANALQRIEASAGPRPGPHNFYRGVALAARNDWTRAAIAASHGFVDTDAVTRAWETDLRAPIFAGPPVWIHGDIQSSNLLVREGTISAVIDFGGLGVGDPACELLIAWSLLTPAARDVFRGALEVDDATWARGRGTALSVALIALPYYRHTSPEIVQGARLTIAAVLADHERGSR